MFLDKIITILGFLVMITGVYKIYCAIKPETRTCIADPGREPFEGAVIDRRLASVGARFLIYGFLIQALRLILPRIIGFYQ